MDTLLEHVLCSLLTLKYKNEKRSSIYDALYIFWGIKGQGKIKHFHLKESENILEAMCLHLYNSLF